MRSRKQGVEWGSFASVIGREEMKGCKVTELTLLRDWRNNLSPFEVFRKYAAL
jgi:hypothetical protein